MVEEEDEELEPPGLLPPFWPLVAARVVACGGFLVELDFGAAGFFANGLDRKPDFLLFLVHLDDLELVLVADVQIDLLALVVDSFRDVAETLDSFGDFDEGSESERCEVPLPLNDVADAVLWRRRYPRHPAAAA